MGIFNHNRLSNYPNYKDVYYFLLASYGNFDKQDLINIMKLLEIGCARVGCSFNDLSFVVRGNDSIVFKTDNYIFKVMECEYNTSVTDYVSHSNYILKPLYEERLNIQDKNIQVLAFDRLNISDISLDDVTMMSVLLRQDGYLWYDPRVENIGKDSNGNLFLIDFGQLYYINDKSFGYRKHLLADYRDYFPELDEAYNNALNDFGGKRK